MAKPKSELNISSINKYNRKLNYANVGRILTNKQEWYKPSIDMNNQKIITLPERVDL